MQKINDNNDDSEKVFIMLNVDNLERCLLLCEIWRRDGFRQGAFLGRGAYRLCNSFFERHKDIMLYQRERTLPSTCTAREYTIVFSSVGFEKKEVKVNIVSGDRKKLNVKLNPSSQLAEVIVVSNPLSKVKNSAFNATAVNTQELVNTTKTLSEALNKAPGMKIRESGGVGSEMAVTMDGFSGKHVKVFIDGVPQEGVGSSFGLNNIPVNFAERIEIYRGVVPVGFGADAIGGVINIVTPRRQRKWFVDASYSFGSFNTHKSDVNFGQTLRNGFKYDINVFQNYSDNDYWVDTPVEDFVTGSINRKKKEHVKRFNDTYHNEAVVGKVGFVNKSWADRLMVGFTYSHMYKDIQTGVRQEIVYTRNTDMDIH